MANIEVVDGITYSLDREYYVLHHEAGISECDGPYTEREAYAYAEPMLERWKILRHYDEREED